MNQAIHFPDLDQWDDERQSVCFPAMVGGMCAECQVSAGWLCSRFSSAAAEANPLALFRQHRLDVEDTMESLRGWILTADTAYSETLVYAHCLEQESVFQG